VNKYSGLLTQFLHGGALGLIGFSVGLALIKSISLAVSLRYAFVSIISGASALSIAGQTPYSDGSIKYYLAIFAGLTLFFILKGVVALLERFSVAPFKTTASLFSALIKLLTVWRKK